MAIEDFFDHTCDIYHMTKVGKSPGFGLPEAPTFDYGAAPDIAAAPCHFHVNGFSPTFTEREPYTDMNVIEKLALPAGTDVRVNDKIVDRATGVAYTAGVPRDIRGHHISVQLHRTGEQRAL